MRYQRGDIITARGIRCEVDTHVTDADIVPGGDTGLEVVICTALEELPGRHVEGSTLYVSLDEIEVKRKVGP